MRLKQELVGSDGGVGVGGRIVARSAAVTPFPERKLSSLLGEEGEGVIFALGRGGNS